MQIAITNIIRYCTGEQVRILQNNGYRTAQIILVNQLNINTVIGNAAAFNIVKPIDQIGDCRFSCTGATYKSNLLSRLCI